LIILDTNALSEVLKRVPSKAVLGWLGTLAPTEVFTTAITQAEMLSGIGLMPVGRRRQRMSTAVENILREEFPGRILPFDAEAAREFAKIAALRRTLGRPVSQFDAMIAAIARAHGAGLATRNVKDFEHCGIRLIDPWAAS
jgi:toxin FitB